MLVTHAKPSEFGIEEIRYDFFSGTGNISETSGRRGCAHGPVRSGCPMDERMGFKDLRRYFRDP
jgi:hypothetical protein